MTMLVDLDASYVLPPDLRLVPRGPDRVQIGTEPPRHHLLVDAPIGATDVLRHFTSAARIGEVLRRCQAELATWRPILAELVQRDLLVRVGPEVPPPVHVAGERVSLSHRHGLSAADRMLAARSDSLVVVEGAGVMADAVAALLAASGIGHVHQRADGKALPQAARRASPEVRVYAPAPQMPPSLVVLARPEPVDMTQAAALVTGLIPHLSVQVNQARVTVGPLVLPGRSACLNCLDVHRTEADPAWPAVADALRRHPIGPAPVPAHRAAALAVAQALTFVDGAQEPESVGATLEQFGSSLRVHRRRWAPHPACGCGMLTGQV